MKKPASDMVGGNCGSEAREELVDTSVDGFAVVFPEHRSGTHRVRFASGLVAEAFLKALPSFNINANVVQGLNQFVILAHGSQGDGRDVRVPHGLLKSFETI